MRNILALIGAAVVLFVGLGWYFGWYTFAIQPSPDGKQRIEVDVDTRKIAEDVKKASEKVSQAVQNTAPAPEPKPLPADFVGPPPPPDLPARPATTTSAPTPGQLALPQPPTRRN